MEYYSVFKKKEILLFLTTWMKLKYVMVSKISQKEKRQILHNITYMWNLKKKKKKKEKSRTHGSRVCSGGCQGLGNGGNRERLIKEYKLSVRR